MGKAYFKRIIFFVFLIAAGIFLSYRLTVVPPGLTVDEAAFGYNAVLLSRTGKDENGRTLPIFVNSIGGKDWRQPVTQYFITLFFKFFLPSTLTLRLTSIVVALICLALLYYLSQRLLGGAWSFVVMSLFLATPIVFIQSHMALDNIMPVPFVIFWLMYLYLYEKKKSKYYLLLAGVALGVAFYSYKAMRLIVPVYFMLTIWYFWRLKIKNFVGTVFWFSLGLAPFMLAIPFLRSSYPGAVFGGYNKYVPNWNEFLYPYLSSFDPTFLFIKGDATVYHSTGIHGMFLAATLPIFVIGCYQAVKKGGIWWLIVLAFFATPVFFGLANSVHRASRLMAMVPMYVLVSSLGLTSIKNKVFFLAISIFLVVNFYDFVNYYWFTYPKFVKGDFSQTREESYKILSDQAESRGLKSFIDYDLYQGDGEVANFFSAAFFEQKPTLLRSEEKLPGGSILLSYRENIPGLARLDTKLPNYYLHALK